MRVLGISTGRRFGNSETLLRFALKAVKDAGHEVSLIRLQDFSIKPCSGCVSCMKRGNARELPRPCMHQDDGAFVLNEILHCDGLIIAAPNMDLMPHGYLIDLVNRSIAINERARYMRGPNSDIPEYCKVTATIGVGGSNWTHFQMSLMNLSAIWLSGARVALADQMLVEHIETPGIVATLPDACARAEQLGRHVVMELGKAEADIQYHGDLPEACPICHCDALILRNRRLVCPVCNVAGDPVIRDGKIERIRFDYGIEHSNWSKYGKIDHDLNVDTYVHRDQAGAKIISAEQRSAIAATRALLESVVTPLKPHDKG